MSDKAFSYVGYIIFGLLFLIFFFLGLSKKQVFPDSSLKKIDASLGALTYPLYLNHFAVEVVVFAFLANRSLNTLAVAIIGSLALSWIAMMCVEPLTHRVRDAIRGKKI